MIPILETRKQDGLKLYIGVIIWCQGLNMAPNPCAEVLTSSSSEGEPI